MLIVPITFTSRVERRLRGRHAHVDLSGEVEHRFGLLDLEQGRHQIAVADVLDDQLRAVRDRVVQVALAARGEVVEHDHLVAAIEQCIDQIRADEAGSACHKNLQNIGLLGRLERCLRVGKSFLLPTKTAATLARRFGLWARFLS